MHLLGGLIRCSPIALVDIVAVTSAATGGSGFVFLARLLAGILQDVEGEALCGVAAACGQKEHRQRQQHADSYIHDAFQLW